MRERHRVREGRELFDSEYKGRHRIHKTHLLPTFADRKSAPAKTNLRHQRPQSTSDLSTVPTISGRPHSPNNILLKYQQHQAYLTLGSRHFYSNSNFKLLDNPHHAFTANLYFSSGCPLDGRCRTHQYLPQPGPEQRLCRAWVPRSQL